MFKGFKKIRWYIWKKRKYYGIYILSSLLSGYFTMLPPKIIGNMIDIIQKETLTMPQLVENIMLLAVMAFSIYILDYLWAYHLFTASDTLGYFYRNHLMDKLLEESPVFYEKFPSGELMAYMTNDISNIVEMAGYGILCIGDGIIFPIIVIGFMVATTSWQLTLACLSPLPIFLWILKNMSKQIYPLFDISQEAFSDLNNQVVENVSGVRVIRAFVMEEREESKFKALSYNIYEKNLRVMRMNALYFPLAKIGQMLIYIIALIYGAYLLKHSQITIGNLFSFFIYLSLLVWPMFALSDIFMVQERGKVALDRVERLLTYPSDIKDKEDAQSLFHFERAEFKNFSFRYPKSEADVLKDISFSFTQGQTLGIVGKTGSGKTALIQQWLLYYPLQKEFFINGQPVTDYTRVSLREKIGYVSQEQIIFSMSIRNNILASKPEASEEELNGAVSMADFEKDLAQLSEGLDTMAGEKGVALSGGQKQRIAIARALIKNPEILILDDALSAVDAQTESHILDALEKAGKKRSLIIAAHRLSAVKGADLILVLDQGRIADRGTHEELIQRDGWYKEQYQLQQMEEGYDAIPDSE